MTSGPAPSDFWAKLGGSSWLSLKAHSIDVAVCAYHLLTRTLLGTRLASLGSLKTLTEPQLAKIAFLAGIHDAGKVNKAFQESVLQAHTEMKLEKQGHVKPILGLLDSSSSAASRFFDAVRRELLDKWADDSFGLLLAAFQHHGRIYSKQDCLFDSRLWQRCVFGDPFDAVRDIADSLLMLFPDANDTNHLLPSTPSFIRGLNGVITLADWLASDEVFFPYIDMSDIERFNRGKHACANMFRQIGLDTHDFKRFLKAQTLDFEQCFSFKPRPFQSSICKAPVSNHGSVVIIESETGSGKTEAVLYHFLRLFKEDLVDGLYFALPTRTSAIQLFERIVQSTRRVFSDEMTRPSVLLAVPGYLRIDDRQGKILPDFRVLWSEDPEDLYRYRGWAAEHPKRYMAGTIVVGTIDQALLSVLAVPHSHLRGSALLRLLLVVDEVHASDRYQTTLLTKVLRRHISSGGHVALMSATLGSCAFQEFAACCKKASLEHPISLRDAIARPYPAITVLTKEGIRNLDVPSPAEQKFVEVLIEPWMESPKDLASFVLSALQKDARILVLRNTVAECIRTQLALEGLANEKGLGGALFACNNIIAPHHSRFAREDREKLDREVENRFGKEGKYQGACILCGTQTLQQSLDIDADLLITDLCPMDVFLQRVGRLHRHKKTRPKEFAKAQVVVLVPTKKTLSDFIDPSSGKAKGPCGLGTVYEDLCILELTYRELIAQKRLVIPQMNRALVENSLHPERLRSLEKESALWQKHRQFIIGQYYADERLAHLSAHEWSTPLEETPTVKMARVVTRLGEENIVWRLEKPIKSPFDASVELTELPVPLWMCREALSQGLPQDFPAKVLGCESGVYSIDIGGIITLRYSRLGLERENLTGEEGNE